MNPKQNSAQYMHSTIQLIYYIINIIFVMTLWRKSRLGMIGNLVYINTSRMKKDGKKDEKAAEAN